MSRHSTRRAGASAPICRVRGEQPRSAAVAPPMAIRVMVQDLAAADPVAQRAEEQAAERPDHERDAERGEGGEHGRDRACCRGRTAGRGSRPKAVEREVVELDELADAAAGQDPLLHPGGAGGRGLLEGCSAVPAVVEVLRPGSGAGCGWFLMSLMVMTATLGSPCFRLPMPRYGRLKKFRRILPRCCCDVPARTCFGHVVRDSEPLNLL